MEKSVKFSNSNRKKRCSYYNSNGHPNVKLYQQKSDIKHKDSSTVSGKSEKHESFVVDRTTADCNNKYLCCNSKTKN